MSQDKKQEETPKPKVDKAVIDKAIEDKKAIVATNQIVKK